MTSHWKAVLGVLLIFILGFTSGLVAASIFVHRKFEAFLKHPEAVAEATLEKRLTSHLELDPNQKQQIHAIFARNLEERKQLNQQIQPQVRMANLGTFQEINAILRPDQQQRFRENIEQFRNRFGKAAANADAGNLPPSVGAGASPPSTH